MFYRTLPAECATAQPCGCIDMQPWELRTMGSDAWGAMAWGTSTSPLASTSAELAAHRRAPRPGCQGPPRRAISTQIVYDIGTFIDWSDRGKLDARVAYHGATSGMALAVPRLFVDEGAHVSSRADGGRAGTGRRTDRAERDWRAGRFGRPRHLDRIVRHVKQEKGSIDVCGASADGAAKSKLGEITEEDFETPLAERARTLFTVQKALPLFRWRARSS